MTDQVAMAIVGAVVTLGGGVLALLTLKLNKIAKTGEIIHELVNSRMGKVLRSHARTSRRLADITGDSTDDQAATEAEELSREHDEKQAVVDSKEQ